MREKAHKVLFLMEAKRTVEKMCWIQADLPYRCMLAVPCSQRRGGLALLWMEEIDLHIQTFLLNHIDAMIMNVISPWHFTGFYGWPEEQRKQESWRLLKHLRSRSLAPWFCCGDFNEILSSEEKQGGLPKPLKQMQVFRETLLHFELVDLGFSGNNFTWDNGRLGEDFVQERLDRACATLAWRDLFPHAKDTYI